MCRDDKDIHWKDIHWFDYLGGATIAIIVLIVWGFVETILWIINTAV